MMASFRDELPVETMLRTFTHEDVEAAVMAAVDELLAEVVAACAPVVVRLPCGCEEHQPDTLWFLSIEPLAPDAEVERRAIARVFRRHYPRAARDFATRRHLRRPRAA
jgi:hypothetical protein